MKKMIERFRRFMRGQPPKTDIGMNHYQLTAAEYAQYPRKVAGIYPVIGLANEAGEVLGKIKKLLRGDGQKIDRDALISELGDVYWYLAMTAKEFGIPLHVVAAKNLAKLAARKEAGTIKGDGDDR